MTTIAVCVTTIPPRAELLEQTLASIHAQTRPPDELHVVTDAEGRGTAWARDAAWRLAMTDWVATFDDDDVMYPNHLELLERHALETGADVVYPWFDGAYEDGTLYDGSCVEGHDYDVVVRDHIFASGPAYPPVALIRREFLEFVGGYDLEPTLRERRTGHQIDEWHLQRKLVVAGATFSHLPVRTWWRRPDGYHGKKWREPV